MGLQDRDNDQDHDRNASTSRTGPALAGRPSIGRHATARIALLWIVVLAVGYAFLRTIALVPSTPPPAVPSTVVATPRPLPLPTTPNAAPRPVDPYPAAAPAPAPIYRCGNRYGHEPCPGGRVVDTTASSGFESRPSERLARMVAEGRAADDSVTEIDRSSTTTVVNGTVVDASNTACASLASEIVAVDRAALRLQSAEMQDRLRQRRRELRDRQLRQRC